MKISILHISDLHRDPDNPIRNDVLLDSLENDRDRYCVEDSPRVENPNLIIVSGDIVHGIKPDTAEPIKELRKQYEEALNFLNGLTDRFVAGDRGRVVIVPGNHDISAYHFEKSLQRVDVLPDRKGEWVAKLFSQGSFLRWSWSNLELFEIVDHNWYAQRLAAFVDFYTQFYKDTRTYDLDASKQFDMFDFPNFGLTVAAFSSCYNNDLYNRQGAIHPACIAQAGIRFRDPILQERLRIAVWHHNAEGQPMQSDYMDPDLIQNLIDRGFSLGFHGHQHRPQYLDTRFRHGAKRGITVISAGTLCGGPAFRFGRSYNLVELDTEQRIGLLHVREMQNDNLNLPIWGRRALPPDTDPFYKFQFDPPPEAIIHSNSNTVVLIEAQKFYDQTDYQRAAAILGPIAKSDELAKRLLLDCFVHLHDMKGIVATYDPPTSSAEAIHLLDALWMEGKQDRIREVLKLPLIANSHDLSVIEMRDKYAARLKK